MDNEMTEIKLALNDLKNKLNDTERRLVEQEHKSDTLNTLVISVKELAINMSNMLEAQKEMSCRLKKVEDKPMIRSETIVNTIITTVIAGVVGYMLASMGIF